MPSPDVPDGVPERSPTELALAVRLLQMHLREAAQPVAAGMLGQDQLVPLLEPLIVAARPHRGWTLLARMQALGEQARRHAPVTLPSRSRAYPLPCIHHLACTLCCVRLRLHVHVHMPAVCMCTQELFEKPDLASAVDGWESACGGVEAQALGRWRRAAREQTFWRALARVPPPAGLHFALCAEKQAEPLPRVFVHFLELLAERDEEIWAQVRTHVSL